MEENNRGRRQIMVGMVVKDNLSRQKMKTVTVEVERQVLHPIVKKVVRRYQKYLVHDEKNECRNGDRVEIASSRPISKRKRWTVARLVEKAEKAEKVL